MFYADRVRAARALLYPAIVAAVLALGGTAPAHGANDAARSASNSAKLAGAFVNWGPDGRERMLQAWEKWLNQTPSSVLGVDSTPNRPGGFLQIELGAGDVNKLNPARNVVWSVPRR
jgi:hypothetical protein